MHFILITLISILFSAANAQTEVVTKKFKGAASHYVIPGMFDSCWGDPCLGQAESRAIKKCEKAGFTNCKEVRSKEFRIYPFYFLNKWRICRSVVKGEK